MIAVGLAIVVVGFVRGPQSGGLQIVVGIGLCTIGVAELALREHLSGYRSHTLLLAFLPVVVLQGTITIATGDRQLARWAIVPDVILFCVLALWLRRRFLRARERL